VFVIFSYSHVPSLAYLLLFAFIIIAFSCMFAFTHFHHHRLFPPTCFCHHHMLPPTSSHLLPPSLPPALASVPLLVFFIVACFHFRVFACFHHHCLLLPLSSTPTCMLSPSLHFQVPCMLPLVLSFTYLLCCLFVWVSSSPPLFSTSSPLYLCKRWNIRGMTSTSNHVFFLIFFFCFSF
jgi:hypothetical protein